ncbi:hypothetical protein [Actinoplanes sp. NPDC026623]|uniref:hypothetical protein n=1 Tax=Actinoplanes sp. NPDC026623 TaxID=3155610 RepID=UPI0033EB201D
MSDRIRALRDQVALHTGAARARPLVELGQALLDRYWRAGPGSPAGGPDLDEAITVLGEAYDLLGTDSPLYGQLAGQLGWLHGIRHTAHGGPAGDRETGIRLLEVALSRPQQPAMMLGVARFVLGQLLLARQAPAMGAPGLAVRIMNGGPADGAADLDRAVVLFREIIDGPRISAELTETAATMLVVAEAMQAMFGGAGGRMDLGKLAAAMTAIQDFQARTRTPGAGLGVMPGAVDVSLIPDAGPAGRPVAVVDGPVPAPASLPRQRRAAERPTGDAVLRAALDALLTEPVPTALRALLDADPADPALVDDLVAIGSVLAESAAARPADHLAFAAGLYLRGASDAADRGRAAESLGRATENASAESPEFLAAALRLATLLDRSDPALRAVPALGERFAAVAEAMRKAGADALVLTTAEETLVLSPEGRLGLRDAAAPLPPRVLMVGAGDLEDDCVVSYLRSGAQAVELARRGRRPAGEAVFVANPRRDRDAATMDAIALRRAFYPRSTGFGLTVDGVDGRGTPDEVAAHLDAPVLHLGCGITADGALELADLAELPIERVAAPAGGEAGGVVVLPPDPTGTPALIDALLARGAVDVIAFREPVPDRVASLVYFLLHAGLVDGCLDPAAAVDAVRRWMRDPARELPDLLPAAHRASARDTDLADPRFWRPLVCHGV